MIKRSIISEINKWLSEKKIIILKWPRQVWKTTILKIIQSDLEKVGYQTMFFSADLEIWNDIFLSAKNFINFIKTQLTGDKKLYIFIDEFQYIKEAWLFLKWVFDELNNNIQIIVSGSSSLEITQNSEFLTWRKIDFEISGISFFEYISHFSKYKYQQYGLDEIYNIGFDKDDIKNYLLDYVKFGSYPEVIMMSDLSKKQSILKEIVSTYISKDISWFMKVDNISAFNNLLKILANQIWGMLNRSELSNTLNIDSRQLSHFIDILVWTYVIDLVNPYYTNVRKEISKMPKIYFNNLSTINYFSNQNIINLDTLNWAYIENFVFNALSEILRNDTLNSQLFYYRTISKSEIDFILKIDNSLIPIETKYRNKAQNIPLPIRNFEENYKNVAKKIIISKNDLVHDRNNYILPFYLLPFIKKFM